jgi:hypothetical protein
MPYHFQGRPPWRIVVRQQAVLHKTQPLIQRERCYIGRRHVQRCAQAAPGVKSCLQGSTHCVAQTCVTHCVLEHKMQSTKEKGRRGNTWTSAVAMPRRLQEGATATLLMLSASLLAVKTR